MARVTLLSPVGAAVTGPEKSSSVACLLYTSKFVGAIKAKGFIESEGPESVASISERLKTIEAKLDSALNVIQSTTKTMGNVTYRGAELDDILTQLSPIQAFNYALTPVSYTHLDVYKRQSAQWRIRDIPIGKLFLYHPQQSDFRGKQAKAV